MSATKVTVPVIDLQGKVVGEHNVPATLFGVEPNEAVVHFVCEGQRFRFYKKTVSTKGRGLVSGGGRKIRQQKGSGGARQGGNRAPHWVGGGVAFGPSPIKREFKINKKVRQLALASVLTDRHSGGQVKVLKADLSSPKTKSVSELLAKLSMKGARVGFVVSAKQDEKLSKSVRNIKNVDLLTEEKWTTLDFVKTDALIFSETALESLSKRTNG
jgi:large subunit ribosomal protein L4